MQAIKPVDYSSQLFFLSDQCQEKLDRLDPRLAECVRIAQAISDIQLLVVEGKRTKSTHEEFFKKGVTNDPTNSVHFYGLAVDIVPVIEGRLTLEHDTFMDVVDVMHHAAVETDLKIQWGGAPQVPDIRYPEKFWEDYCIDFIDMQRLAKRRPFLELHHFEISPDD